MDKCSQLNHLVGLDKYGRAFAPQAGVRPDRQVGLFFWLWIGQPAATGAYDAGALLEQENGRDILFHQDVPESPDGQQHFWGKPLWGYYDSADEWVIRRQIELLMLAGVDFIVFDTTNARTYPQVYEQVLAIIQAYQQAGWNPPRAAFYTHSHSLDTVRVLYEELYRPGKFASAWYQLDGKPLIIAYTASAPDLAEAATRGDTAYSPAELSPEILDFFTFKRPQWPFDPFYPDGFPWIEWTYPQPLHGDVMNVTVASHPNVPFSFTLTRGLENWGRGWDPQARVNRPEDVDTGAFFQKQWDWAIENDPALVFVGGWNEWIAYKQLWEGEYMLCDAVDREFSRDIEPMCGGYEDAFYIQLIRNIRRYKGLEGSEKPAGPLRLEATALPPIPRDHRGVSETIRYTVPAPVNPLRSVEAARVGSSLQLTLAFTQDVRACGTAPDVLLGTGSVPHGGWQGYAFRLRCRPEESAACLETLESDGTGTAIAKFPLETREAEIRLSLPLEAPDAAGEPAIYLKAASEVENPQDILSYYTSGSTLPPGRLSYSLPLA